MEEVPAIIVHLIDLAITDPEGHHITQIIVQDVAQIEAVAQVAAIVPEVVQIKTTTLIVHHRETQTIEEIPIVHHRAIHRVAKVLLAIVAEAQEVVVVDSVVAAVAHAVAVAAEEVVVNANKLYLKH